MRRARIGVAPIVVALVLAACGAPGGSAIQSGGDAPSASAGLRDELQVAMDATVATGTVRISQSLEISGSIAVPSVSIDEATIGQAGFGEERQMRMTADLTALAGMGRIDMIRDGSLMYARGAAFEELAGPGNWLLVDLDSDDPAVAPFAPLASGQNDLTMAIFYLYGLVDEVSVEEGVTLADRPARVFSGEADLEAARETIPEARTESLEDLLANMRVTGISPVIGAEAWVADDGLIHQVRYVYRIGEQLGGGTMTTVMQFSDHGEPMDLDLPDESEVVNIEDIDVGGG